MPRLRSSPRVLPLIWSFACVLGLVGRATAVPGPAPSWFYDPWRTNHGLPNNDVTGVAQGRDGALLVATLSGLVRFDGLRFRPIRDAVTGFGSVKGVCVGERGSVWFVSEGRLVEWMDGHAARSVVLPPGSSEARLTAIFGTPADDLWISHERGPIIHVNDGNPVAAPTEEGLAGTFASMVTRDAKGEIWAAGRGVLAKWDGEKFVRKSTIPTAQSVAITAAGDGGLWVGAGVALMRYREEGGLVPVGELTGVFDRAVISTLLEDGKGNVWCGTLSGGLHCWVGDRFERVNVAHHDVWALMEDVEQNMWVCTGGGGLVRVRLRIMKAVDEANSPISQTPRSLCGDASKRLWVVMQTGDVYTRGEGRWRRLDLAKELRTSGATCVTADDRGTVWIACTNDKLARWDGTKFQDMPLPPRGGNVRVHTMMAAKDGTLWVGRGGELLHESGGEWKALPPGASGGLVCTLAQDRAGVVWAGTTHGQVLRTEGSKLEDVPLPAARGGIRCLMAAPDGGVWAGNGEGLWRIKAGRTVLVASTRDLGVGAISQLTLDDRRQVWLGVDQGVLVVPLDELDKKANGARGKVPFSFYVTGGYQMSTGYTPNTALMPDGWLWCCSRTSVMIANVDEARSNIVAPKASIEALQVDGAPKPLTQGLRIGPQPAQIDFELGAMSYRFPENVKLFHRIAGVDSGWVDSGKDRIAHYPRLPPGRHVLQVRAENEDGVESETDATLSFEVVPAFWETKLFRGSVLALAAGLLLMGARLSFARQLRWETASLREQVAINGERVRIARDMHDQLGASLTQMSLLADLMGSDGVDDKRVSQFARTVRQASAALDEIVWAVNPRHDSLGSVLEYLGQQVANLLEPTGLRCRLDLPADTPERHLPAEFRHQLFLIVREAVNNVIKHASATEVDFSAEVTTANLRLVIKDDGKGSIEESSGDGVPNMRARAAGLGGHCEIRSDAGQGTIVEVQVPWPQRRLSSQPS